MPRLRFKRKPKDGQMVTLIDGKTYRIKVYKGVPLLRRITHTPPVYYVNHWYIPGVLAARSPYRYDADLGVAPPSKDVFPTYQDYELLTPNSGLAIAASVNVTTRPIFAADIVAGLIMLWMILFNGLRDPWFILAVAAVFTFLTWFVHLYRLSYVHVVTANSLRQYKGFWVWAHDEMVQSQDIDRVRSEVPKPQLWWSLFSVKDVEVQMTGHGHESMTLVKVANGDAVKALILALQESLEKAEKDSSDAILNALDVQIETRDKVSKIADDLERVGRAYVATSNRDARLMRELIELNTQIILQVVPLLRTISKAHEPGVRTGPIEKIHLQPDGPSQGGPPKDEPNKT